MPGITMIGDARSGAGLPTALPAEARSLCRFLRLLKSPQTAADALLDTLGRAPPSVQRTQILCDMKETLESLSELDLAPKESADRISIATELAIRTAFEKTRNSPSDDDDASSLSPPPMTTKMAETTARAAVVSDSSTAGSEEETESLLADESISSKRFWAFVLESVHLQIASRTTTVWGKKKIYEIYQLSAPCVIQFPDDVAKALDREFRAVFHGGGEDQSGCRTYALQSGKFTYIQLNIGKPYDFQDERNRSLSGEKKKKKGNEFIAVLEHGSPLIALTASRAPSKSRFLQFVLTALDAALNPNGGNSGTSYCTLCSILLANLR